MKISELEQRVSLIDLVQNDYKVKKHNSDSYSIEPCPVCNHKEHLFITPSKNLFKSFSSCCDGGSVYQYLQQIRGLSEDEAYKELKKLAGVNMENEYNKSKSEKNEPDILVSQKKESIKDHTKWILDTYKKQTDKEKEYFYSRGIGAEIINKYKLCVTDYQGEQRAIIPVWEKSKVVSFNARAINDSKIKYKKPGGDYKPFNARYLDNTSSDTIFICEGEFDALSLETMGYKAIGLGGLNSYSKIEKKVKEYKGLLITAFDNDTAGIEASRNIGLPVLNIPGAYKDINEWFSKDSIDIKTSIQLQLPNIKRPHNIVNYLDNKFFQDISDFTANQKRKTGFNNLDKELKGLHSGLYVIGGISSVGKTTFAHQVADQIAEQGEHVLYFSLEQSTFELVAKSIARETKKNNFSGNGVSSFSIRGGYSNTDVLTAINKYKKIADKINIIEGNFDTTAENIQKFTSQYMQINKVKPVVFIDYLQIVQGDPKLNDKQRIDQTTTALKRMSRDLDLTVFVISSLNRGNYLTPIDFESFKESGGIEYTADVVLGLQLKVLTDDKIFNKKTSIKEQREALNNAKKADPREIELVCLKNRCGIPYFKCDFSYQPKYDYYMEQLTGKKEKIKF